MISLKPIKRGDTLQFKAKFKNADGQPASNITTSNLKCQCRKRDRTLLFDFVITQDVAVPGQYIFTAPSNVSLVPFDNLLIDIQFTKDGNTFSTETFSVLVEEDITQ